MASSIPKLSYGNQDILRYKTYDINLKKCLGEGKFGTVYEGLDTTTKIRICAKRFNTSSGRCPKAKLEKLKSVSDYNNVAHVYDNFTQNDRIWIVMELCYGKSLDRCIATNPSLHDRFDIIYQLTDTLAHLHTLYPPVAHGNIHSGNVIVSKGSYRYYIKLCDVSHMEICETRLLGEAGLMDETGVKGKASKNSVRETGLIGKTKSSMYLAPEVYGSQEKYDALEADVFSTGLLYLGTITCQPGENMEDFFSAGKIME